MIRDSDKLLSALRSIHDAIRDAVVASCEREAIEWLAAPLGFEGGDTIYALDRVSEQVLLQHFRSLAQRWPCVLIAEGLANNGMLVLPEGLSAEQAELRIIVDPIDGTRGLMYQKRPGWILTGVAPNRGPHTSLADIELALMTEIPLVKQHLSDSLWAEVGRGAQGERLNRLSGARQPLTPRPSQAQSIAGGFGAISRFFPGVRDLLAELEEQLIQQLLGPAPAGTALTFEDQYICSGGQLYELLIGHDRWIADLRPLLDPILRERGTPAGLHCHPYDLCSELIAREAGVIVCDPFGAQLNAPLDVHTPIAWVGYANRAIQAQIAAPLAALISARSWASPRH